MDTGLAADSVRRCCCHKFSEPELEERRDLSTTTTPGYGIIVIVIINLYLNEPRALIL